MINTQLDFFAGTGQFGSLTHNSANHRKADPSSIDVGRLLNHYPAVNPETQTVPDVDDMVKKSQELTMRDLWSAV